MQKLDLTISEASRLTQTLQFVLTELLPGEGEFNIPVFNANIRVKVSRVTLDKERVISIEREEVMI